jgi:hypothetical protein
MIERSGSYANTDEVVDGANDKLKLQCQQG